ncbi:MAG: response regulator transcription factor [Acidobacteriota bacterium]
MKRTVLIVEDDPDIVELVAHHLSLDGFEVLQAGDGEAAMEMVAARRPDLVLLDLALPGIQGLEVCRILRRNRETERVPIVMLTARGEETDIVLGLELGADDYITKPFRIRELLARVHAVLRRSQAQAEAEESVLRVGPLELDAFQHEVRLAGRPVEVTPTEFRLLRTLAAKPGRVFTRAQLVKAVTGGGVHIIERNIDVHVRAIRAKLGEARELLETVRGVGYRLVEEVRNRDCPPGSCAAQQDVNKRVRS